MADRHLRTAPQNLRSDRGAAFDSAQPIPSAAPRTPRHTSPRAPLAPLIRASKTHRFVARLSKAARIAILRITCPAPVLAHLLPYVPFQELTHSPPDRPAAPPPPAPHPPPPAANSKPPPSPPPPVPHPPNTPRPPTNPARSHPQFHPHHNRRRSVHHVLPPRHMQPKLPQHQPLVVHLKQRVALRVLRQHLQPKIRIRTLPIRINS